MNGKLWRHPPLTVTKFAHGLRRKRTKTPLTGTGRRHYRGSPDPRCGLMVIDNRQEGSSPHLAYAQQVAVRIVASFSALLVTSESPCSDMRCLILLGVCGGSSIGFTVVEIPISIESFVFRPSEFGAASTYKMSKYHK
jgi:hypothetical protein